MLNAEVTASCSSILSILGPTALTTAVFRGRRQHALGGLLGAITALVLLNWARLTLSTPGGIWWGGPAMILYHVTSPRLTSLRLWARGWMMSRGAISGAAFESVPEESLTGMGGHRSDDEHATRSIAELVAAHRPPVPARLSRADVGLPMTSPPPPRSAPRANAVRAPRPRPRSFALARPDHHHATAEDSR